MQSTTLIMELILIVTQVKFHISHLICTCSSQVTKKQTKCTGHKCSTYYKWLKWLNTMRETDLENLLKLPPDSETARTKSQSRVQRRRKAYSVQTRNGLIGWQEPYLQLFFLVAVLAFCVLSVAKQLGHPTPWFKCYTGGGLMMVLHRGAWL